MLNLIIKDLIIQRKMLLFGFIYVLAFMFAFRTGESAVYTAGVFAVVLMLVQTPCAHDDKCHADKMLNSLPVSRAFIVTAKYLSVAVYLAVGSVQYMAVYGLVRLTGVPMDVYPVTFVAFIGLLFVSAVFSSVYYPIFFRFGYMKTRYLSLFLFAGLFSAGSAVVLSMKGEDSLPFGNSLSNFAATQPGWLLVCGIMGIILALTLASWGLSVRFYGRRDF